MQDPGCSDGDAQSIYVGLAAALGRWAARQVGGAGFCLPGAWQLLVPLARRGHASLSPLRTARFVKCASCCFGSTRAAACHLPALLPCMVLAPPPHPSASPPCPLPTPPNPFPPLPRRRRWMACLRQAARWAMLARASPATCCMVMCGEWRPQGSGRRLLLGASSRGVIALLCVHWCRPGNTRQGSRVHTCRGGCPALPSPSSIPAHTHTTHHMCRPDELHQLLKGLMARARQRLTDGPLTRVALARWLHYPFLTAEPQPLEQEGDAAMGGEDSVAGMLAWETVFGDALAHTVGLAAEFALSPGPVSAALVPLLSAEVLPPEFGEYVAGSLAALEGAGEAAAAQQLGRQLAALAWLHQYTGLDESYAQWKAGASAVAAGEAGAAELEGLVQAGHDLAAALLGLAAADALAVLADPHADPPSDTPTRLVLLLAAPLPGAERGEGGERAPGAEAEAEAALAEGYPRMTPEEAEGLCDGLAAALDAFTSELPDVSVSVSVRQQGAGAGGMTGTGGDEGAAVVVELHSWEGQVCGGAGGLLGVVASGYGGVPPLHGLPAWLRQWAFSHARTHAACLPPPHCSSAYAQLPHMLACSRRQRALWRRRRAGSAAGA